jgi:hypothetical protein
MYSLNLEVEMAAGTKRQTPWYLWPFTALWNLLTWILNLTGRLLAALLGLLLMVVGLILTVTLIGAPIGIPLGIIGLLLVIRSIF